MVFCGAHLVRNNVPGDHGWAIDNQGVAEASPEDHQNRTYFFLINMEDRPALHVTLEAGSCVMVEGKSHVLLYRHEKVTIFTGEGCPCYKTRYR